MNGSRICRPVREPVTAGAQGPAARLRLAGALAWCGHIPFVHTFGVFATRRPYDQIANAIAYPALPVRIIGFMPGVSSPGGPSHQAIDDVALFASGMMLASALAAARALRQAGVSTSVVNVPVIKPLDTATVTAVAAGARVAITAENHSVIGGLGSAVAEALAEAAVGCPLRRRANTRPSRRARTVVPWPVR
jgi:transketolase C-terminal domain/subunit